MSEEWKLFLFYFFIAEDRDFAEFKDLKKIKQTSKSGQFL